MTIFGKMVVTGFALGFVLLLIAVVLMKLTVISGSAGRLIIDICVGLITIAITGGVTAMVYLFWKDRL